MVFWFLDGKNAERGRAKRVRVESLDRFCDRLLFKVKNRGRKREVKK
jgi:hypothetical protein